MPDLPPTPLPKKLGISEGSRVGFVRPPKAFTDTLGLLPEGVSIRPARSGPLDVVVLFTTRRADLERRFGSLQKALDPAGGLWVAYPKKSAGVPTDLSFSEVQEVGLASGLVDNKSCAIDEVWTAVRFVIRKEDRKERR